jgi:hypothetical protein
VSGPDELLAARQEMISDELQSVVDYLREMAPAYALTVECMSAEIMRLEAANAALAARCGELQVALRRIQRANGNAPLCNATEEVADIAFDALRADALASQAEGER